MNANELADKLSDKTIRDYHLYEYLPEIVAMLRQQQAQIEALKSKCLDEIIKRVYAERATEVVQELYTHPAKELTDEEILNEWLLTNYNPKTYVWANDTDDDLVLQFAKAILRKAQEK